MALRVPPLEWVSFPEAVEIVSPPLTESRVRTAIRHALQDGALEVGNMPPMDRDEWREHARSDAPVWKTGCVDTGEFVNSTGLIAVLGSFARQLHLATGDGSFRPKLKASQIQALFTDEAVEGIPAKHPGGAPSKYDWFAIEARLEAECELQESVPRRDHSDSEWRTQADAHRLIRAFLSRPDGGPSDAVLKERVPPMLKRIEERLRKGGN